MQQSSGHRALIVDDHDQTRAIVSKILSEAGYEVRDSGNGYRGIEMWASWKPSVVIADAEMPLMTGAQFGRVLRDLEKTLARRTALLMLTAHVDAEHAGAALRAGFDAFLAKPLSPSSICRAVSDVEARIRSELAQRSRHKLLPIM
jgi:CheY-like chemotaxis protein